MPVEVRTVTSREEWLAWRTQDVTASSAAALLALHPWTTPLMLHMDKLPGKKRIPLDGADSPGMKRGRLLEPLGETMIREAHPDWEVWKADHYCRDPEHRLGATPDFYVRDAAKRLGVVQVKSIEPQVFERSWRDPESGDIIAPTWVGIQASLERHLTGAEFAMIGALRVGYAVDFDLLEVPHTPGLIERLEAAAAAFWRGIEKGEPPSPDFFADADLIRQLHQETIKGKSVDLTGNNRIAALAAEDARLAGLEKEVTAGRKAIKAEVIDLLGLAELGTVDGEVVVSAKKIDVEAEKVPRKGYSFRKVNFRKRDM